MALRLVVAGTVVLTGTALPLLWSEGPGAAVDAAGAAALAVQEAGAEPVPPAPTATREDAPRALPLQVEVRRDADGAEYATLVGTNVSLATVLRRVAGATDRILFGLDERGIVAPLVTVELRDRPLEEALEYLLGSAGLVAELNPDVLQVRVDEVPRDRELLLGRALAGYSRAGYKFPDHPLAARARLEQGRLEEQRGLLDAALSHYQLLVQGHPTSPLVLEAHLRTGAVLQRQGEYALAIDAYRQVSEVSPEGLSASEAAERPIEEYVVAAKLEVARCNVELGRPEWALLMLRVLDRDHPAASREAVVDRALLRARAFLDGGAYVESLRVLDELERGYVPAESAVVGLELRARCFEGLDLRPEAARAWLIHARQVREPQRARSYERAAELFLALEDHLGVLFLAGEARSAGSPAEVDVAERVSRAALGLSVELDAENSSVAERAAAAAEAAERADWERVATLVAPLFGELEIVPQDLRDDVALTWARARYATAGLDAALAVLRTARAVVARTSPEDAMRLDAYAGQLLESESLFERALEAYDGSY